MSDFEAQERRISEILGQDEIPGVDRDTLRTYLAYLKASLLFPCQVTGGEDFGWEEYYLFGPGDKEEYEQLKKTKPSHKDSYELLEPDDDLDETPGVLVKVKRLSDKKTFVLPLADLEATDKASGNYQLLDDYSVWYVNWR
ncbi:hypothetical protein BH24DEI1_BH24DEI1_04950 [soil metagenome]|jgi:hypothetical protein|nr:hypothetical protein [Deinococcota bacterium]